MQQLFCTTTNLNPRFVARQNIRYNRELMESNQGNRRQFWIGMGVSLLCLIAIFVFIDPREIIHSLRGANLFYLGLGALGILAFMFIRAIRWRFLLGNELNYWSVFHVQNVGYMLNMYLPARAGDVARAILIGSVPPVTIAQGISTMVVERLLDMMFIVALLPFTLATVDTLPENIRQGAVAIGVVAVIGIVVLIIAANFRSFFTNLAEKILNLVPFLNTEAWTRRVDDLLKGLDSLTRLKDGLILILFSILVWLPIIFAYQMSLKAVGLDVTLGMAAFVVCAAALGIAAPSSPGGVGVFQLAVVGALFVLGQPNGQSVSFAFAYHATNYFVLTILGLIGLTKTGSTFRSVIETTQNYLKRNKSEETQEKEPT